MQTAITVFTPHGQLAEVQHGPETLEEARERLHAAMRSGNHAAGRVEIWTATGVTDRFVFKAGEDKTAADEDIEPNGSSV